MTNAGPLAQESDEHGLRTIESAICSLSEVAGAVAAIQAGADGAERIVVYARPELAGPPLIGDEVRAAAADLLPDYAVPDVVVVVQEFPATGSGEIDLESLARVPVWTTAPERSVRYELLCALFAGVVGRHSIELDRDFFSAGGNSLLVTRLASHIRSVMNSDVTVRDIFDAAEVGALIRRIAAQPDQVRPKRTGQSPDDGRGRQARNDLNQVVLELTGMLDQAALNAALGDVIARHEPTAGTAASGGWLHAEITETESAAVLLAMHPLGLPFDRWSESVLTRDLAHALTERRAGRSPHWECLPLRFADWTSAQADFLGSEDNLGSVYAEQLAYWVEQLRDMPAELALPADRPRPSRPSGGSGAVPIRLLREQHAALRAVARKQKATVAMVAQAAFAALLSRLGAGPDIPLGYISTGRSDPVFDSVIGDFENPLVLRLDTASTPVVGDLVGHVRAVAQSADARRAIPFGHLVEKLDSTAAPSRHPLFQVALRIDRGVAADLRIPGLLVRELPGSHGLPLDLEAVLSESLDDRGEAAGIEGWLRYSSDLFDQRTAEWISECMIRMLAAIGTAPTSLVEEIELPQAPAVADSSEARSW
jgi:hypothetical protein